jgi:hypothetical protein
VRYFALGRLRAGALNDSAEGGVYRSYDGGATWDTLNQGLTDLDVQSLGQIGGYGDSVHVYLAGTKGGIFRWATGDSAWSWVGPAVNASICDFGGDLYSAYAAWGNGSWSDGVYKSGMFGEIWTAKQYHIYTRTVTTNPISQVSVYAGALGGGVFRSTDIGETWEEMNQGLTDLDVIELAFCATDTTWLYAGTEGGGVFRFGIIPGVEERDRRESEVACPRLKNVRPNPFSTSTTIAYFLPSATPVILDVYDVSGSHVRTLMNGVQEPGNHNARWERTGSPSGVYFCRLKAGELVETKMMVAAE